MLDTPSSSTARTGRPAWRDVLHWLRLWPYTFAVLLSVLTGVVAVVTSHQLDRPILDPDGFLGPAYVRLPLIGLGFLAADVVPRGLAHGYARARAGGASHPVAALASLRGVVTGSRDVVRDQWSWGRLTYVAAGLLTFYACYVSYRNLKSWLPLVTTRDYDTTLDKIDAFLFFGTRPSLFLHDVLGTGVAAHVLSALYVGYLVVVPITLAAMLVWSPHVRRGAWVATAFCLNWVLGVVSYYILPTLGPGLNFPQYVQELPDTGASTLQNSLALARGNFVTNLDNPLLMQGVAGFASLHVSVVFTACLIFQRLRLGRWIQVATWTYFVATLLSTLYFGWHYVSDDVGGLVVGWLSVAIGARAAGVSRSNGYIGPGHGPDGALLEPEPEPVPRT